MTNSNHPPSEIARRYVSALRRIALDRGKIAALRRGLSDNPRLHIDSWPIIADLGGDIDNHIHVAIAALYATHPEESEAWNIGQTCREIADQAGDYDGRFRRLLACDDTLEVIGQLRSWIRLAASKNVGVNYESLMWDLLIWNAHSDDIRVRWAQQFWKPEISE